MAIKCAVLLLCVAFISPLVTKHVKKEKTKEQGNWLPLFYKPPNKPRSFCRRSLIVAEM